MRARPSAERGFSLGEQLIALACLTVLLGAAMGLLASAAKLRGDEMPSADRVWTLSRAHAEIAAAESAAAQLAYFDLAATVAAVRARSGASGGDASDEAQAAKGAASAGKPDVGDSGGGGPKGEDGEDGGPKGGGSGGVTPPAGYCGPVELGDPSTWPSGLDPGKPATYSSVAWWPGFDKNDPSTWYYECASTTGPKELVPIYSYGTGVRYGRKRDAKGKPAVLRGPAAVAGAEANLFDGQVGDALVVLKTEPGLAPFALGGPFVASSERIRLAGRDAARRSQIEGLRVGDLLVVTGRSSGGRVATAIAELAEAPRQIAAPSYLDAEGAPLLQYYEARVLAPDAEFRWGLRNSEETETGVTIEEDAAVALLSRSEAVVAFYTAAAEGEKTELALVRIAGSPETPESFETLVPRAAAPLSASVATMTTAAGETVASGVTATMSVQASPGAPSEPLHVEARFLGAAQTNRRVGFTYGTFPSPVASEEAPFEGGMLEVVIDQ